MSNAALNGVFTHSKAKRTARMVLITIADRANEAGVAWCGEEDIAARAGMARKNVPRVLKELVGLGELTIELRAGPHRCNIYQIAPGLLAQRLPRVSKAPVDVLTTRTPHSEAASTVDTHGLKTDYFTPHPEAQTQGTPKNPNNTSKGIRKSSEITEEEFLALLQTNPAYRGLDLATERLKAEAWLSATPGRKFTNRFFVNWLNRAPAAAAPADSPNPPRKKLRFQL